LIGPASVEYGTNERHYRQGTVPGHDFQVITVYTADAMNLVRDPLHNLLQTRASHYGQADREGFDVNDSQVVLECLAINLGRDIEQIPEVFHGVPEWHGIHALAQVGRLIELGFQILDSRSGGGRDWRTVPGLRPAQRERTNRQRQTAPGSCSKHDRSSIGAQVIKDH
jgi:hypothetical protein